MPLLADIEALALQLAHDIVAAVRDVSLNDLVALGERSAATVETAEVRVGRGRAPRTSPPARAGRGRAPADLVSKAIEVLRRSPEGVRTETLRTLVGGEKGAYQRAMVKLVAEGRVVKTGEKRATTYRTA
jgi:hypothetical protein